jgi:hypothetical protein
LFYSKSNLVEVLENGTTVGIDSGITLQLTMTDNGKGTTDLFWNYIAEERCLVLVIGM